jgi:hypothetical protein
MIETREGGENMGTEREEKKRKEKGERTSFFPAMISFLLFIFSSHVCVHGPCCFFYFFPLFFSPQCRIAFSASQTDA